MRLDLRHRRDGGFQGQRQEAGEIGKQDDEGRGVETEPQQRQRLQEEQDAGDGEDHAGQRIG